MIGCRRGRERGTSLVEFALVAPIFITLLLVVLQVAILFAQAYGVREVTRSAARWLAIHPDTTDAALMDEVRARVLPAMDPLAILAADADPPCPALSGGHCTARVAGDTLTLTVRYDLTSHLFLPPGIALGNVVVGLPTELAPQTVAVTIE